MRLSRNEIRARAANFAREWADAVYEKGETWSFYNDFFEIFGKRRRDVPQYEEHVSNSHFGNPSTELWAIGLPKTVEQDRDGRIPRQADRQCGLKSTLLGDSGQGAGGPTPPEAPFAGSQNPKMRIAGNTSSGLTTGPSSSTCSGRLSCWLSVIEPLFLDDLRTTRGRR